MWLPAIYVLFQLSPFSNVVLTITLYKYVTEILCSLSFFGKIVEVWLSCHFPKVDEKKFLFLCKWFTWFLLVIHHDKYKLLVARSQNRSLVVLNGNVKYFSGIKRAGHVNFLCAKHSSNLICLFPFQNVEKGKRGPRGRQVSKIYFLLGFSRWFPFRCIRSNWQLIIHSFILIRLLA